MVTTGERSFNLSGSSASSSNSSRTSIPYISSFSTINSNSSAIIIIESISKRWFIETNIPNPIHFIITSLVSSPIAWANSATDMYSLTLITLSGSSSSMIPS